MGQDELDARIQRYYGAGLDEAGRLTTRSAGGQIELSRIQELLTARLVPRSRILDVGGATGVHAAWLAERGHAVTLVDPVPEQVAAAAAVGTFHAEVGDARSLRQADASFDAVLLLGPLYHLEQRDARLTTLGEARRVLRPGGLLVAGAISRAVAALDLVLSAPAGAATDRALRLLLTTGQSAPDLDIPGRCFPGGHVHTAAELIVELIDADLRDPVVIGVEGPGSLALELVPPTAEVVAAALALARHVQHDPRAADLSGHLLGIATR